MVFKQTEQHGEWLFLSELILIARNSSYLMSRFETRITYVATLLSGRNNGD